MSGESPPPAEKVETTKAGAAALIARSTNVPHYQELNFKRIFWVELLEVRVSKLKIYA